MEDITALQREMQAGFDAMKERLDDQRDLSSQRHAENVQRLTSIDLEVKKTNGRVTRTEEQIRSLFRHWKDEDKRDDKKDDDGGGSYGKREAAIFAAGAATVWALIQAMNWLAVHGRPTP